MRTIAITTAAIALSLAVAEWVGMSAANAKDRAYTAGKFALDLDGTTSKKGSGKRPSLKAQGNKKPGKK